MEFGIGSAWAAFEDLDLDTGMAMMAFSLSSDRIPTVHTRIVRLLTYKLLVSHTKWFPIASLPVKHLYISICFSVLLSFVHEPNCICLDSKRVSSPNG